MTTRRSLRRLLASCVLVVVAVSLAVRLEQVHGQTWEWRLQPRPLPAKIVLDGRDYTRAGTVSRLPAHLRQVGRSPGGAELYADPPGEVQSAVPTGLYAQDHDRVVRYALLGGP